MLSVGIRLPYLRWWGSKLFPLLEKLLFTYARTQVLYDVTFYDLPCIAQQVYYIDFQGKKNHPTNRVDKRRGGRANRAKLFCVNSNQYFLKVLAILFNSLSDRCPSVALFQASFKSTSVVCSAYKRTLWSALRMKNKRGPLWAAKK